MSDIKFEPDRLAAEVARPEGGPTKVKFLEHIMVQPINRVPRYKKAPLTKYPDTNTAHQQSLQIQVQPSTKSPDLVTAHQQSPQIQEQ